MESTPAEVASEVYARARGRAGLQPQEGKLDTLQGKERKKGPCGCRVGSAGKKGVRRNWELGKHQNR